jgi:hypothetical protein
MVFVLSLIAYPLLMLVYFFCYSQCMQQFAIRSQTGSHTRENRASDRPFIAQEHMSLFDAIDRDTSRRYGPKVKAAGVSNVDYKIRFSKLSSSQTMSPPPSCGRIFPGYVVVRKLGTPDQYETWMPDHVFEELYRSSK